MLIDDSDEKDPAVRKPMLIPITCIISHCFERFKLRKEIRLFMAVFFKSILSPLKYKFDSEITFIIHEIIYNGTIRHQLVVCFSF